MVATVVTAEFSSQRAFRPLSGEQPKIYVVNYSGHDIEDALGLTDLPREEAFVFLTEGRVNLLTTDRLLYGMSYKMRNIRTIDYLLFSGPSIPCALALVTALAKNGTVQVLIYTGMNRVIRTISWHNIQNVIKQHIDSDGGTVKQWA